MLKNRKLTVFNWEFPFIGAFLFVVAGCDMVQPILDAKPADISPYEVYKNPLDHKGKVVQWRIDNVKIERFGGAIEDNIRITGIASGLPIITEATFGPGYRYCYKSSGQLALRKNQTVIKGEINTSTGKLITSHKYNLIIKPGWEVSCLESWKHVSGGEVASGTNVAGENKEKKISLNYFNSSLFALLLFLIILFLLHSARNIYLIVFSAIILGIATIIPSLIMLLIIQFFSESIGKYSKNTVWEYAFFWSNVYPAIFVTLFYIGAIPLYKEINSGQKFEKKTDGNLKEHAVKNFAKRTLSLLGIRLNIDGHSATDLQLSEKKSRKKR